LVLILELSEGTKWFELEEYSFEKYCSEFSKKYASPSQFQARKSIFDATLKKIKKHNADKTQSWKMGVNQFTDMTHDEFSKVLGVDKDILWNEKYDESVEKKIC